MSIDLKPDYTKYTISQLIDVSENIDRERYPDRYAEIVGLLRKDNRLEKWIEENRPKHEGESKKIEYFFTLTCLIFTIQAFAVAGFGVLIGKSGIKYIDDYSDRVVWAISLMFLASCFGYVLYKRKH